MIIADRVQGALPHIEPLRRIHSSSRKSSSIHPTQDLLTYRAMLPVVILAHHHVVPFSQLGWSNIVERPILAGFLCIPKPLQVRGKLVIMG